MIFADTGALFAVFVPSDPDHNAAAAWLSSNTQLLVTTDYVVDELLTLLKVRGEYRRALHIGKSLISEESIELEWVVPSDVRKALDVYGNYGDKAWSFTDCISFVVMNRLEIETAFAFDRHFRQFGKINVVP